VKSKSPSILHVVVQIFAHNNPKIKWKDWYTTIPKELEKRRTDLICSLMVASHWLGFCGKRESLPLSISFPLVSTLHVILKALGIATLMNTWVASSREKKTNQEDCDVQNQGQEQNK
jgi:hypothetical protein